MNRPVTSSSKHDSFGAGREHRGGGEGEKGALRDSRRPRRCALGWACTPLFITVDASPVQLVRDTSRFKLGQGW